MGTLLFSLFPLVITLSQATATPLPPDALKVLDSLPGRTLSLDYVVTEAIRSSDNYREILSQKLALESALYQSKAPLDYRFFARGSRFNDKREQTTPFGPRTESTSYGLGVATYFRTGTELSAELFTGRKQLDFDTPLATDKDFKESTTRLMLTQNLWKDAFGYSTRKGLERGEELSQAAQHRLSESQEEWLLKILDLYYKAWLSKAQLVAAQEDHKRRTSLEKVTQIRRSRGTAESSDLLQIQGSVLNSSVHQDQARQELLEVWRLLVIDLRLPEAWLEIDPLLVPVELGGPIEKAQELCKTSKSPEKAALPAGIKRLEREAQAADLSYDQAKNDLAPKTTFNVILDANGLDPKQGESLSEATGIYHPAWTLMLELQMPLGRYAEKARLQTASADRERLSAQLAQAKSNMRLSWLNTCSDLDRLKRSVDLLKDAFEKQNQRSNLDEKRFQNGQIQATVAIQTGDDTTAAELQYNEAQVLVRQKSWEVFRLAGLLGPYIEARTPSNP